MLGLGGRPRPRRDDHPRRRRDHRGRTTGSFAAPTRRPTQPPPTPREGPAQHEDAAARLGTNTPPLGSRESAPAPSARRRSRRRRRDAAERRCRRSRGRRPTIAEHRRVGEGSEQGRADSMAGDAGRFSRRQARRHARRAGLRGPGSRRCPSDDVVVRDRQGPARRATTTTTCCRRAAARVAASWIAAARRCSSVAAPLRRVYFLVFKKDAAAGRATVPPATPRGRDGARRREDAVGPRPMQRSAASPAEIARAELLGDVETRVRTRAGVARAHRRAGVATRCARA